jgi:hypothetical protein
VRQCRVWIPGSREDARPGMTHEGGYVKPANRREDRADRRFAENQSGKRKVVTSPALGTIFMRATK